MELFKTPKKVPITCPKCGKRWYAKLKDSFRIKLVFKYSAYALPLVILLELRS